MLSLRTEDARPALRRCAAPHVLVRWTGEWIRPWSHPARPVTPRVVEPSEVVSLGEELGGYRLVRVIGSGSTSTVFLGEHIHLGRKAAIKVLSRNLVDDDSVVRRLLTEARVVNDIGHPNLIDVWDFVKQRDRRRIALVMEYIEGPSLKDFRGAPLDAELALELAVQLLDAVGAAHAQGVIHRDLKPDNLLLTFDPREFSGAVPTLKVVDFGIAKLARPSHQYMTAAGTMLGTPAYMAPEQIAGSPSPSSATDVFALGEVLYEMLSGERAYPSDSTPEIVRSKLRGERPILRLPDERAPLLEVIQVCLAVRPSDRPTLETLRAAVVGSQCPVSETPTDSVARLDASRAETGVGSGVPFLAEALAVTTVAAPELPLVAVGNSFTSGLPGNSEDSVTDASTSPDRALPAASPVSDAYTQLGDLSGPRGSAEDALRGSAGVGDQSPARRRSARATPTEVGQRVDTSAVEPIVDSPGGVSPRAFRVPPPEDTQPDGRPLRWPDPGEPGADPTRLLPIEGLGRPTPEISSDGTRLLARPPARAPSIPLPSPRQIAVDARFEAPLGVPAPPAPRQAATKKEKADALIGASDIFEVGPSETSHFLLVGLIFLALLTAGAAAVVLLTA